MAIKNFLSPEEKHYLQNALKKEDRAEVREGTTKYYIGIFTTL
ncbi:hypothetical protein [Geminocystis sp.]